LWNRNRNSFLYATSLTRARWPLRKAVAKSCRHTRNDFALIWVDAAISELTDRQGRDPSIPGIALNKRCHSWRSSSVESNTFFRIYITQFYTSACVSSKQHVGMICCSILLIYIDCIWIECISKQCNRHRNLQEARNIYHSPLC
jgi:hypothetical protein